MGADIWLGKSARYRLEDEGDNPKRSLKQMSASNGPGCVFDVFEHANFGMHAFVRQTLPVVTSQ